MAAGDKVHGHKEAHLEALNKLPASKCVAVADTSIYWEHHCVEAVCYLPDVLQFTQILLLMGYRIYIFFEFFAVYRFTWLGIINS